MESEKECEVEIGKDHRVKIEKIVDYEMNVIPSVSRGPVTENDRDALFRGTVRCSSKKINVSKLNGSISLDFFV